MKRKPEPGFITHNACIRKLQIPLTRNKSSYTEYGFCSSPDNYMKREMFHVIIFNNKLGVTIHVNSVYLQTFWHVPNELSGQNCYSQKTQWIDSWAKN